MIFLEWRRGLYELILNGIQGIVKKEAVVSTLNDLSILNGALPSTIVDLFTLLDAEIQGDTRANYKYIVKECEKVYLKILVIIQPLNFIFFSVFIDRLIF